MHKLTGRRPIHPPRGDGHRRWPSRQKRSSATPGWRVHPKVCVLCAARRSKPQEGPPRDIKEKCEKIKRRRTMQAQVPLRPETNNGGFPNRRGGRIFLFRQRKCAATRPSGMLRAVISDTNPVRVFVCLFFSVTPLPIRCFASTIFVALRLPFLPRLAQRQLFFFFRLFLLRQCSGTVPEHSHQAASYSLSRSKLDLGLHVVSASRTRAQCAGAVRPSFQFASVVATADAGMHATIPYGTFVSSPRLPYRKSV